MGSAMHLDDRLKDRRAAIVDRWTDLALRVYPEDSARFMKRERDRFRNPVGQVTHESLAALFDGLLASRPTDEMKEALDGIVRIRAVQDLAPSHAVGFVFLLKRAVREEVGDAVMDRFSWADLSALDAGVDRLALHAFERFMECRETVYDLRVREIKRRTSTLLARIGVPAAEQRDTPTGEKQGRDVKGGSVA